MTSNPYFKGTTLFGVKCLRNGPKQKRSYFGILIVTYTRPSKLCNINDLRYIICFPYLLYFGVPEL